MPRVYFRLFRTTRRLGRNERNSSPADNSPRSQCRSHSSVDELSELSMRSDDRIMTGAKRAMEAD